MPELRRARTDHARKHWRAIDSLFRLKSMKLTSNPVRTIFGVFILVSLVCSLPQQGAAKADTPAAVRKRIVVGPNILASRDGDFYHAELMVAVNPKNPKNLVGAAITPTAGDGGAACRAYTSFDGGYTWNTSVFPEEVQFGGGDPQVAFSPHGTAYFTSLVMVKDDVGRTRAAVYFYRSEDGGRTWSKPADLGYSYDHPQIIVDNSYGKFAGRIYIGVLYGHNPSTLGVFRSDDDGRTFTGPVKVVDGGKEGVIVTSLVVLSDGTLGMTYESAEIDQNKAKQPRDEGVWIVTSTDGGITYSSPVKVATFRAASNEDPLNSLNTPPTFVSDTESTRFKDRIYGAFCDYTTGKPRLLFTYSSDRGRTWTQPKQFDSTLPADAVQYQPALAVNRDGVFGALWFDSRGLDGTARYNAYFAASDDGGETFLPAAKLSWKPSDRWGAGNLAFSPLQFKSKTDTPRVNFLSAAMRWSNGGDYMGLVADSNGTFHPFWADGRTGTFQAMTNQVQVVASDAALQSKAAAASTTADLTSRVEFIFDRPSYDPATRELLLPIRLKNVSDEPISKPITATVKGFGSSIGTDMTGEKAPLILNSENGKNQVGASIDYSPALRDWESLNPGTETEAVVWRLRLGADPSSSPESSSLLWSLLLNLTGNVPVHK